MKANARGAGTRAPRHASKPWPALRRRSAPLLDRHFVEAEQGCGPVGVRAPREPHPLYDLREDPFSSQY
jgi:hypothetical protein